jgi:hypothetical protein
MGVSGRIQRSPGLNMALGFCRQQQKPLHKSFASLRP